GARAALAVAGHGTAGGRARVGSALAWPTRPRRRQEGGFLGAARVQQEIAEGPARRRVGLKPEGRQPAREGAEIRKPAGGAIGKVTSGGFGPTVGGPIAMGYVDTGSAEPGTPAMLVVREK